MFNVGPGEIALIAVAALLVLGPSRLPELARGLGHFMREFRRQTNEVRSVVEKEFGRLDDAGPPQMSAAKPSPGAAAVAVPAPEEAEAQVTAARSTG